MGHEHGERGAEEEFPGAEGQQEKAGGGAVADRPGGEREAQAEDEQDGGEGGAAPEAPEGEKQQREEQVELLLDAEAPGVQQRQAVGVGTEIVELLPEEEVGDGKRGGGVALGETAELERREPDDSERDAGEEHDDERGQDAAGAALVEAGEREAALGEVADEDAGDQVPGDHEEDVDAEIAAGKGGEAGVEEDHRHDGDGAQAVDVAAMRHVRDGFPPGGAIEDACHLCLAL